MNQPTSIKPRTDLAGLKAEIRARRDEFQAKRHVPADIVKQFQDVGVYRAFVPTRFGGDGKSPAEFCRMIEEISWADASCGWVASFGVSTTYLAALPIETYTKIYGSDPNTVFSGGMYPPQAANRVAGGLEVSGRWPWVSGVMGASLVGAGIKIAGESTPLPRTAIMQRKDVTVIENWDTISLRATGSHDITAEKVFVPEDWTFIRGGKPSMDDAIFRYPAMALAAQVLAVVALGTARAALDWLRDDAVGRTSVTGAPSPAARGYVQTSFAKAEGILLGARCAFYEVIEEGWRQMLSNGEVDRQTHIRLRQVASKAAEDGAEAARIAFVLGGSESLGSGHPLGRYMLDAAGVAQHAFIGAGSWQMAGAAMLDQPAAPGFP